MRLIILFLSLLSFLQAQATININSNNSNIKDFEVSYFVDTSNKLEFKDIKSMNFIKGKNKDSLGVKVTNAWIKIKISNTSKEKQTLFLHQSLAYKYTSLEYFEVDKNESLIRKQIISPNAILEKNQLNGADAIFKFSLDSNEFKTIYVRQKTPAYFFYDFSIFSQKESTKYLIYEKVDAVLISGLLLALALYNFLIFISSRYKEYLYYSLYLTSSALWIFYVYGSMAHYFEIYGAIPLRFNFGIMIAPIFLSLFIQTIFKTEIYYIKEHKLLNSVMLVAFINFIYGLIDFTSALKIMPLALNYALIIFMWISISIYLKNDKLIKIFLFAHTFYLIFSIYALFYYIGWVDVNYVSSHGTSIGLILEAFLLSYLVSYKFKIMEQEKEEDRIKQIELKLLASTDPMTKLYNRRYFSELSEKILSLSKREKKDLSIIILDIDKFKKVNDTYGHQFGDKVLITLSNKLIEYQRKSDIICRYGGEEFVILLPNSSIENATIVAQNIRKLIESSRLILPSNKEFKFTISLGVAQIDIDKEYNIESALKRADKALYRAKTNGRNRVCFEKRGNNRH
ncbi:MAG: diguanylate cyclase [Halarcobacter sp.]